MNRLLEPLFRSRAKITTESIKRWNFGLAFLHAAQGIAILVLSAPHNLPLTVSFLTTDSVQTALSGKPMVAPATYQLGVINLSYLIAAFFFIAAVAHLLAASVYRVRYEAGLKKSINPLRWIDYSLSGGTILVIVAFVVGMYDIGSLVLIFTLTAATCLLSFLTEIQRVDKKQKQPKISIRSWLWGICGIVPWLIILLYLVSSAIFSDTHPSLSTWLICGSTLLLFVGIGVDTYLQFAKKGKWADYAYAEVWYMGLSLAVRSLLAWQLFVSLLHT